MVEALKASMRPPMRPPVWPRILTRAFPVIGMLIAGWLQPPVAQAHRLDELLQAALISLEPDAIGLELNLTPGVETAPALLSQLDLDHDGILSAAEASVYAHLVGSEISLNLDDRALSLKLVDSQFPTLAEISTGLGTIHLELSAAVAGIPAGSHELRFQNQHRPDLSIYLVNAVMPKTDAVQVTGQVRNDNQSQSRILFTTAGNTEVPPMPAPQSNRHLPPILLLLSLAAATVVVAYILHRR